MAMQDEDTEKRGTVGSYLPSVDSRAIGSGLWLLSVSVHLWALNWLWIDDCAFPRAGSPANWALHRSQIPNAGMFLTRRTIRRLRLGMSKV
ncbi:MAG: hypothetical protein WCC04_02730 [Terriglobales bacterium]